MPDTLYEYLNGGAERYGSHGFRRLVHVRYRCGEDPLACVTLDIFDMGSELGAFGIFSAGRPAGREPRPWGSEGYRIGAIAAAYKGSIFVHGEADDERDNLLAMLERLMVLVVGDAAGSVAHPAILARLPTTHLLAGSERYVPDDLLGHAFLPGGVTATYEIDGGSAELFFSELDTEETAVESMVALRNHYENLDAIAGGAPSFGSDGFRFSDPVIGWGTVVRDDDLIAGIQGDGSPAEMEVVLLRLITSSGAPNPE